MHTLYAPRASAILYNLLVNQPQKRLWLLPANICPIVPLTFFKAGAPFEFVDLSAETLHIDENQVEGRMKRGGVGGLLFAHTYGDESTPAEFFRVAKSIQPDVLILNDRCLCRPVFEGTEGADVTLFSTGYAKLAELNGGGYAFAKDDVIYQTTILPFAPEHHEQMEQAYKAAVSKQVEFVYQDSDWLETRADLPAWDIYKEQVETALAKSLAHRKRLNEIYTARLPAEIQLPPAYQTWRFNIRVKNKSALMTAIFKAGLFASSHYASLVGIMGRGHASVAEQLADEVINLFNDHHFTEDQAERVCEIVLKHI